MRLHEVAKAAPKYRTQLGLTQAVEVGRSQFFPYFQAFSEPEVFRGASGNGTTLVNPAAGKGRDSAYTTNEYTVLMSELPAWSAFPKRSRSIVCSTDPGRAGDYGDNTFVVVLPKQFNLGVCSSFDLWYSFPYLSKKTSMGQMNEFNESFGTLVEWATGREWYAKKQTSLSEIKEKCGWIQEWIEEESNISFGPNRLGYFLNDVVRANNSSPDAVFDAVADLFDPVKNKFQRYTSIPSLHSLNESQEVWTDSPCMLVPIDDYDNLRNEVVKGA
jgi:hypothetical protein